MNSCLESWFLILCNPSISGFFPKMVVFLCLLLNRLLLVQNFPFLKIPAFTFSLFLIRVNNCNSSYKCASVFVHLIKSIISIS